VRSAVLLALLAGCATLSGLDDKRADLEDTVGVPNRPGDEGGSSSSSGGPNGLDGGSNVDAPSPDQEAGPATTRIRDITFEDNALIHPVTGFDATTGAPQLLSTNPLGGKHSMFVGGSADFGTVSFAAVSDLFIAMRFRVEPADGNTIGDARILRVSHASPSPIDVYIGSGPRDLGIIQGNEPIASFANLLTDGTIYRLELSLRSAGDVKARLSNGVSMTGGGGNATVGAFSKVEAGAVTGGSLRIAVDDISLDSAMMP
jgi:hypothetical protein